MNRAVDVVGAGLGLALTSPVLAAAAVAIKLEDGGPVLYRQRRVGKDGEEFDLLKLRTMVVGAERQGAGWAVNEGDPRITRVGRVLRKTSLDELPQLFNVLKGDMSLVGPRPVPTYEVAEYQAWHRERLAALPGITGLWQVKGRCQVSFDEMIRMDIDYVRSRSLWLDVKLLFLTIPAVLSGRGAE